MKTVTAHYVWSNAIHLELKKKWYSVPFATYGPLRNLKSRGKKCKPIKEQAQQRFQNLRAELELGL